MNDCRKGSAMAHQDSTMRHPFDYRGSNSQVNVEVHRVANEQSSRMIICRVTVHDPIIKTHIAQSPYNTE